MKSSFQLASRAAAGILTMALCASAQIGTLGRPELLRNVGLDQKLNSQLPLDASFLDEEGKTVHLGDYFRDGKPVVLALVYYSCPMLCNLELEGLFSSIKKVPLKPGKDYQVVAISFDARDTPALAAAKKATYVKYFGRPGAAAGIHFLTGQETDIRRATDAAGFHYAYDRKQNQFAHASAIMIATPEGRLSRYFYGIHYIDRDVRLGLVEASENKIGSPSDEILLFCFHYDPMTGKYGFMILNILRLAGALTVLGIAIFLLFMFRRERSLKNPPNLGGHDGHWRSV